MPTATVRPGVTYETRSRRRFALISKSYPSSSSCLRSGLRLTSGLDIEDGAFLAHDDGLVRCQGPFVRLFGVAEGDGVSSVGRRRNRKCDRHYLLVRDDVRVDPVLFSVDDDSRPVMFGGLVHNRPPRVSFSALVHPVANPGRLLRLAGGLCYQGERVSL